ncbi:MAG: DedA family protein, partial [Mycobacterium sp.]
FFEKYGPWAIILARFVPFARTFVPVIAGVSYMRYPAYLGFDIVGGTLWGAGMTMAGYFLGTKVPGITDHLELIIIGILLVSLVPAVFSVGKAYLSRRRSASEDEPISVEG